MRLLLESFVRLLRRRDDYVDVRQSIDEVLDEEAQVKPLQDTYDPAEGEGQSAEHDDAKGVHRSIEIKVFASILHLELSSFGFDRLHGCTSRTVHLSAIIPAGQGEIAIPIYSYDSRE